MFFTSAMRGSENKMLKEFIGAICAVKRDLNKKHDEISKISMRHECLRGDPLSDVQCGNVAMIHDR